jgi:outer membrane receptor protein involved in Fe transport
MRLLLSCVVVLAAWSAPFRVVDAQGKLIAGASITPVAVGGLRIEAPGFESVLVRADADGDIVLYPARSVAAMTITATPGLAEEIAQRPEMILAGEAPKTRTVANALAGAPNVLLQQTGAGQVSAFLRGMTGYQVLNLIDGVRFNNATFRSGPNQYLAYIEPSQAAQVEAMLGPSGTQYGSDGLGGTIQVFTGGPRFVEAPRWRGALRLAGETADLSAGASASVSRDGTKWWWQMGTAGARHGDLRAGRGFDSHNVLTRLYGYTPEQVRDALGSRLRETAYSRGGAHGKIATRGFTAFYQRGEVHGLRNTKDLWGGLGRLQSTLSPQVLDLFYARYEKLNVAGFDSLSGRFSVNRQQDGSLRQGLRVTDSVTREYNGVRANGYTGQGIRHFRTHTLVSMGGEVYDERVDSTREINGASTRPLYPSNSRYRTSGVYSQAATTLRRFALNYGVRYQRVLFSHPTTTQSFQNVAWNGSVMYRLTNELAWHATVSRGFRSPNLNDLSALGLNDLGFEIPAREASAALLADSAGEAAISKGIALRPLGMEKLRNFETGIRYRRARVQFFDALLTDPIARRTLLFPISDAPTSLAGINVTPIVQTAAQRAQGVVAVAPAGIDSRAVKAFVNDGRARYWGFEADNEFRFGSRWHWYINYSFLLGRDLDPNRNIRRLPPQQGATRLLYRRSRIWAEARLSVSGAQDRLSGGDRDDERIGASRRRQDIADFYNAARFPTSEPLRSIQDRVLPGVADTVRVTLFNATPGWASIDLRAGIPLGEMLSMEAALTNIADRNYRVHGSGIDAPGRSAHIGLAWRF